MFSKQNICNARSKTKEALCHFVSKLPNILVWSLICTALFATIQVIYERRISGSYLLNVQSVTVQDVNKLGADIPFTFCRSPRYDGIFSSKNIRTFYLKEDKQYIPIAENIIPRAYYENIPGQTCLKLKLRAETLPTEPGEYRFCQYIEFEAWKRIKQASFCSNDFMIVAE